jgi:hypothetical protein
MVCLYQKYKYRIPKDDPLKLAQYTIPTPILNFLLTSFNINPSYFSSPVTCPIQLNQFYSPFSRDKIFGSIGKAFDHKWKGIGYVHPHDTTDLQHAIHWARLAAKKDPNTFTILIAPYTNWYQNFNPHSSPFPYTHIIAPLCCKYYYIWGHSRLRYFCWVSNGKRTFLDNFTCLVCLDLYCEACFGSYVHFILHIEYTNKVNLEGIGSSKISF